jgi:predicted CoA-binding protein
MKSIAIVGASNDRAKFGNKAVRAFVQEGWQVFPVNPNASEIEGLRAYPTVADLPVSPKLVSLYVPPAVALQVLPDIAERGCEELWLNPGADSEEVVAAAEKLGLNVIQACSLVGHGISPEEL